ncbi:MAG: 30S ribosomal protein S6 [Massiliimalia sp.]|jgi:small subunit ribosomal protein S6
MAKLEQNYEAIVILSTKLGEEGIKAAVEKFTALISKEAKLDSVDEWGKRRLAYAINYETEGYYVMYTFNSAPAFPAELDRIFKITDGVMRSLIVAKED